MKTVRINFSKLLVVLGAWLGVLGAAGLDEAKAAWAGQDVGTVGVSGSNVVSSGTYTLSGEGVGFSGTSDSGYFLYQQVSGDCEITTKVNSLSNPNALAAGGLVLRNSLAPGSVSAAIYCTASNGIQSATRYTLSGTAQTVQTSSQNAPAWLKLVRSGTSVKGYFSTDGVTWSLASQTAVPLSATYYVGLAVASHSSGNVASAVFSRVTLATNLPTSIDGMSLWLKADNGVVFSGSAIYQWNDQSGNSNHAVQATGTSQPIWVDSQINGQPILRFDGTNDYLSVADATNLKPSQFTVFVVGNKQSGGSANGVFLVKSSTTTGWANGYGLTKSDASANVAVFANSFASKVTGALASGTYAVLSGRYDGSVVRLSVSSTSSAVVTTGTYTTGITNTTSPLLIGASGTNNLQGDIAEVLFFNRALTDSERTDVEAYLYSKYGIGTAPAVASPALSGSAPLPGIYATSVPTQPVSLAGIPAGAVVYYTLDGSDPTTSSFLYDPSNPPVLSGNTTIKFKAFKMGYAPSATLSQTYTVDSQTAFSRSGLALWLRADQGITYGASGTTVSQWSDQSGNGNDAVQVTGTKQPVLVSSAINGKPAIEGTASSEKWLSVADSATIKPSQLSLIVVGKHSDDTQWSQYILKTNNTSWNGGGYGAILKSGAGGFWVNVWNTGNAVSAVNSGTFHALMGTYDAQSVKWYVDGSLQNTRSYTTAISQDTSPLYIGGQNGLLGYSKTTIAEVLLFNHALSDTELQNINAYLHLRYNLGATPQVPALTLSGSSPQSGLIASVPSQPLVLTNVPSGVTVYYTTNGVDPTTSDTAYDPNSPPVVTASGTMKFKGFKNGYSTADYLPSPTLTLAYSVDAQTVFTRNGLSLWLRSDQGVAVSGSAVSRWNDLSGNGNNAVQSGTTSQPILKASQLNGQPSINFDGSNDSLSIPDASTLNPSQATIFVVAKYGSGGSSSKTIFTKSSVANWTNGYVVGAIAGAFCTYFNNQTGGGVSVPWTTNTFAVVEGGYDLQQVKGVVLSGSAASVNYTTPITYAAGPATLGATAGADFFQGDIVEVLMFGRALTDAERQEVEAYLYFRYNVGPLPQTAAPVLSGSAPVGGVYAATPSAPVSLGALGSGVTVYYTTNGIDPTTSDAVYDPNSPPVVTGSETLKFKAFKSGYAASATLTLTYTIDSQATFPTNGLVVWLRADQGVTVSGSNVSQWSDLSGNGNNAVQSGTAKQPFLVSSGSSINGKPYIDGQASVERWLAIPDNNTIRPSTLTAIVVGQHSLASAWCGYIDKPSASNWTGGGYGMNLMTGWGSFWVNQHNVGNAKSDVAAGAFHAFEGSYDGQTVKWFVDSVLKDSRSYSTAITQNSSPLYIAGEDTLAFASKTSIAEVMLFNRALSDAERQQVEAYLYFRYNIGPVPQVATPVLSGNAPAAGVYTSAPSAPVSLGALGSGVTAYYTTDGSDPTTSSSVYDPNSPPVVTASETLKFKAFKSGYTASTTLTLTYAIDSQATFPTSGLVVWLRADQGVTVSGSNVSQWNDLSGNGNHAVQSGTAKQPFLVSSGSSINGKPYIDGQASVERWLAIPDNSTIRPSTLTAIVVGQHSLASAWCGYIDKPSASNWTGGGYGMNLMTGWGSFWVNQHNVGNARSDVAAGAFHALAGSYDGQTVKWFVDGVLQNSRSYSTAVTQNSSPLYIAGEDTLAFASKTSIAEVMLFNRALSDTELYEVNWYLYTRYGLPAPTPVAPSVGSISVQPGSNGMLQTVALGGVPSGLTIYYTTDGSDPTTSSLVYTGPITASSTTKLKFKAFNAAGQGSLTLSTDPAATAAYSIGLSASGTFVAPGTVTLTADVSASTSAIQQVNFYQGSTLLGTVTQAPYTWQMTNVAPGNYLIKAISYDALGKGANASTTFDVVLPGQSFVSNRYVIGGSNATYQAWVQPLDENQGVALDLIGDNHEKFPAGAPWLTQIYRSPDRPSLAVSGVFRFGSSKPGSFLTSVSGTVPVYDLSFENPVVAFGNRGGATPLYTYQTYSYVVSLPGGGLSVYDTGTPASPDLIIETFSATQFSSGAVDVYPIEVDTIALPKQGTAAWTQFVNDGYVYSSTSSTSGFQTTVQFQPASGTYLVKHKAVSSNYYQVVSYLSDISIPNVSIAPGLAMSNLFAGAVTPCLSYTMDFQDQPVGTSSLTTIQPQFQGIPLPSAYQGKSLAELINDASPVADTLTAPSVAQSGTYTTIDASPELRRHPILDQFVASMNNDPIALANYVLNEIEVTNALGYSNSGTTSLRSINSTGVSRNALGTYLEGQGTPAEQCGLLVYLLRQAGYPAVYIFPTTDQTLMLDQQLSKLLRMQIHGAQDSSGQSNVPTLIPVNYPWVAAYIGGKWVHIFPWMKDTAVQEGFDLWNFMPDGYKTGAQWTYHYLNRSGSLIDLSSTDDVATVFPKFVKDHLSGSVSLDDVGVKIYNRRNYFTSWNQFPRPWQSGTIASGNVVTDFNSVSNIFDTIYIKVFTDANGDGVQNGADTSITATGTLRLADLENRRLLIYAQQLASGTTPINQHRLTLSLESFSATNTGTGTFQASDTLLNKQVVTGNLVSTDDNLSVLIDIRRHRQLPTTLTGSNSFLDFWESRQVTDTRPLRKGDMAALCLDYGRVSQKMLELQAEKYWAYQQQVTGTSTIDQELAVGLPLNLMGMSYYYKVGQMLDTIESLTKTQVIDIIGHGFAKLSPTRTVSGTLPNNGEISLVYPRVDMKLDRIDLAGNTTLHADSGEDSTLPQQNAFELAILGVSSLEHETINEFFGKSSAISTVKLLENAQDPAIFTPTTGTDRILVLTTDNYAASGTISYTMTVSGSAKTQSLMNWAGGTSPGTIWSSIVNALSGTNPDSRYTTVMMTPGPIPGAQSSGTNTYVGMGAMILGIKSESALISDNLTADTGTAAPNHGGYGPPIDYSFKTINLAPSTVSYASLQPTPSYTYSYVNYAAPQPSYTYVPQAISVQSYSSFLDNMANSSMSLNPWQSTSYAQEASYLNISSSASTLQKMSAVLDLGEVGRTVSYSMYAGATSNFIADPVNTITGEFYINALDLRLNGPMPLDIRRNYGSGDTADSNYGYGWKPAYFPYLVVSSTVSGTGTPIIYAAEMDGSVVAYRQTGTTSTWKPTLADNPQLENMAADAAGSITNMLNNTLVVAGSGTSAVYTLNGADGSVRTFNVQSFPITNTGTSGISISRQRPYLQKWKDNRGNYYTFSFGTNANAVDYGQLTRITASNGNYAGFLYDTFQHIAEAYTGDGRRLYYKYDNYGDLVQVTQPDASTISYAYQHQTGTNSQVYSTHLLVDETKPQGRVVHNNYSGTTSRVAAQSSTVDENSLTPVTNATFTYSNTANADGTFTGSTTIVDYTGTNTTTYAYVSNQVVRITDALGQVSTQEWFQPGDGLTGTYPRSLKSRTDKRGLRTDYQYDSKGNLLQSTLTGDLTGSGTTTETATTTRTYNAFNMVTQTTDPLGNVTVFTYSDTAHPYNPTLVESRTSSATISTTQFQYQNVTSGTIGAYGVLQQQTLAAGTSDEAVVTFTNNANGFVTSKTQPTGTSDPAVVTNYFYNLRGELVSETDALGRTTNYAYDGLGHRIWSERRDEFGILVGWQYDYYNQNGQIEWSQGPRYYPEDYVYTQYDGAGRKSQEIRWRSQAKADGSGVEAVSGDAQYATTFYHHDKFGNLTEIDDPRQNAVKMTYDKVGQMLTRTAYSGTSVVASGTFTYEAGGQVATATNPLGGVETRTYTSLGQLASDSQPDGTIRRIRYDLNGRKVKETLPNGSYQTLAYDDLNGTTTATLLASSGSTLATTTSSYDHRGNLIARTDEEGNTFTTTYDDLNRVKTATGPAASGSSAQQSVTHSYDTAGSREVTTNGLGEQTITLFDALQRPTMVLVNSASGTTASVVGYWYSPDHQSVTTTVGSGASGLTTTDYTNTFGQKVLTRYADGSFKRWQYDANGNQTAFIDELGATTSTSYDALNRVATQTELAATPGGGAVTSFVYDAMGNLLQRQMPGSTTEKSTYDNAGRKLTSELDGSGTSAVTRKFTYVYDGTTGLLASGSDPRGISTAYTYDAFLRPVTIASTGGTNAVQNQTTSYTYDKRDLVTQVAQSYGSGTSVGPATMVNRAYDAYGQISQETILINGGTTSQFGQSWNGAGRRTALAWQLATSGTGAGTSYAYQYDPNGMLTQTAVSGQSYNFGYRNSGQLQSRSTPWSSQAITRDNRGRITAQSALVGATSAMAETQTWRNDSRLTSSVTNRGATRDARNYDYDARGRLIIEPYLNLSGTMQSFGYQFDGNTENGLGIRTSAYQDASSSYIVNTQDLFKRPTTDTSKPGTGSTLSVGATYDAYGNVSVRNVGTGTQTLTWDGEGRLVSVNQRDGSNNGYNWSAIYDGLGRRLKTINQTIAGGSASGSPVTVDSLYDPQVEFQEIAVSINGSRTWKVYGPDLSGVYGGAQGIGGVQATIDESTSSTTGLINNAFGDILGTSNGSTVTWAPVAVGAYGLLPGSTSVTLDGSHALSAALAWRSHYIDPTGFYYLGARYYDPASGRFLSPDPLGHGSSPSLYDYANGDPVNGLDPDGRFGKAVDDLVYFASTGRDAGDPNNFQDVRRVQNEWNQAFLSLPVINIAATVSEAITGQSALTGERFDASHNYTAAIVASVINTGLTVATLPMGGEGGVVSEAAEGSMLMKPIGRVGGGLPSANISPISNSLSRPLGSSLTSSSNLSPKLATFDDAVAETAPRLNTMCFVAGTKIATQEGSRPIEALQVGDRVRSSDGSSATEVDPATWRKITLKMVNPECPSDVLDVALLRPLDWIAATGSSPGAQIWFDLPEMDMHGAAQVQSIEACPAVESGEGRVVLTTVTHFNSYVMALKLEGSEEILHPTDRHRLYSVTRHDWIPTAQLQPGEELQTEEGVVRVVSVSQVPGTHRVHNFEVEDTHSYYVGTARVLSHNIEGNGCSAPLIAAKNSAVANVADDAVRFHHAWPKYLGGEVQQILEPLPKSIHDAFHSGLDKVLPRQAGTAYYEGLAPAARKQALQDLGSYTKAFDAKYGTKLYDAMVREGFPH